MHCYHDVFPMQLCKKKRGKTPKYLLFAFLPTWHQEALQEASEQLQTSAPSIVSWAEKSQ